MKKILSILLLMASFAYGTPIAAPVMTEEKLGEIKEVEEILVKNPRIIPKLGWVVTPLGQRLYIITIIEFKKELILNRQEFLFIVGNISSEWYWVKIYALLCDRSQPKKNNA